VRIKGTVGEPFVLLAFSSDGMVVRERSEEHVVIVQAGIENVVVLRAKYLEQAAPIAEIEVLTLGDYEQDPDLDQLIRICSVLPPTGSTAVLAEHIDMSFRDSIEGFTRRIVREVVDTVQDLPAVSGYPATADVNFISNTFGVGSSITIGTDSLSALFPIVAAVNFSIAPPAIPGLSRVNPSQVSILPAPLGIVYNPIFGYVTITTEDPHNLAISDPIRITDASVSLANSTWVVEDVLNAFQFRFSPPPAPNWDGGSGSVVNTNIAASVTCKTNTGVTHTFSIGERCNVSGASEPSFNGTNFLITNVLDSQTFVYSQYGYATKDSGNGTVSKAGMILPENAIEIGESYNVTAYNFQQAFRASILSLDIKATALGSSDQFEATKLGVIGNLYTLAKAEPTGQNSIVLSGSHFAGGVDPSLTASTIGLQSGDLYVVLYGESGQIEIWGYDGSIFRNLTSATTATVLDFHRRNLYMNELHLSENEKNALQGSVGTPSATNKYVTQEDSSIITAELAAALQGADNTIPSASNRFLTEARRRGQRGLLNIPDLLNDPPLAPVEGDTHLIGATPTGVWTGRAGQVGTWTSGAWVYSTSTGTTVNMPQGYYYVVGLPPFPPLDLATESWKNALQFFNIVFKDSLLNPSGPTEYTNQDFSPITITNVFTEDPLTTSIQIGNVQDEYGVFPRRDAANVEKPLWLFLEISANPDNGKCALVYSEVKIEKERNVGSDMISQPQTIISAGLQDVKNKVSELTFNKGISLLASGTFPFGKTLLSFPTNLFSTENIQTFKLSRIVGSHPASLVSSFQIDFQLGTGTFGIVNSFTPVTFGATQVWTKYVLALTPQGKINVYHISRLLENSTDLSESSISLSQVAKPTLPFVDGSFIFGTMGVQSTGLAGTTIEDLLQSSLELFPYQSTNAKDYAAPIICGDGTNSFGHFSGVDAHIRALQWAESGSVIKLQIGTYEGNVVVEKDDITIDNTSGALLTTIDNSTVLKVIGSRFKGRSLRFDNCSVAVDIQGGADTCSIQEPWFGTLVSTKIKAPGSRGFTTADVDILNNQITITGHGFADNSLGYFSLVGTGSLPVPLSDSTPYYILNSTLNTFKVSTLKGGTIVDISTIGTGTFKFGTGQIREGDFSYVPARVATWTITDGTNSFWAGDFNSLDAIQKAHDIGSDGDYFLIYPGTYNPVIWTLNNCQIEGFQAGKVKIDGGGPATCLEVYGKYNQFSNLILQSSLVGIQCQSGAEHNTFASSIIFADSIVTAIKMPETITGKHYNYHHLISGTISSSAMNSTVTVGDGTSSWGDYVGVDAITLATQQEGAGTKILVRAGLYNPIVSTSSYQTIEGAGAACLIEANALSDDACISITGDQNRVSGFYLYSVGNLSVKLKTIGVSLAGEKNLVENIIFEEGTANQIEPSRKYFIDNGSQNRIMPHTGAPTDSVSWTVGDGVKSFGDFNGADGITSALNSLPSEPSGISGIFSSILGATATFTSDNTTFDFDPARDIYKYINVNDAGNAVNIGSFQITGWISTTQVTLTRFDSQVFIAEAGLKWDFAAGSKIIVLPGQYTKTTIPLNRNDVDLEAWGAGSDVFISGTIADPVLLTVNGNRCRIKGFRFSGGTLSTGVAIQVNGQNNTFEAGRFETALRYAFGSNAFGNQIYDAPEAVSRTAYTVAGVTTTLNLSRADFVGSDQVAIQAAINAASADKHINRVVLGKGTWTLTATVTVPSGLTLEGSGYGTLLTSVSGLFPALTLGTGGGQTIRGIRFSNFSNSLIGAVAVANVFAYNNWLVSAPINGNVTGSMMNL
jgi:hypothetical protein